MPLTHPQRCAGKQEESCVGVFGGGGLDMERTYVRPYVLTQITLYLYVVGKLLERWRMREAGQQDSSECSFLTVLYFTTAVLIKSLSMIVDTIPIHMFSLVLRMNNIFIGACY